MAASIVKDMIAKGAKVIDVRTPDEFADGAYPGATNVPLGLLQGKLGEIGPKDGSYVLYCASGARSSQAARVMKQAGFANVVNAGGLDDMPD
jgi:Rhodanese-related sulfurtransferase